MKLSVVYLGIIRRLDHQEYSLSTACCRAISDSGDTTLRGDFANAGRRSRRAGTASICPDALKTSNDEIYQIRKYEIWIYLFITQNVAGILDGRGHLDKWRRGRLGNRSSNHDRKPSIHLGKTVSRYFHHGLQPRSVGFATAGKFRCQCVVHRTGRNRA